VACHANNTREEKEQDGQGVSSYNGFENHRWSHRVYPRGHFPNLEYINGSCSSIELNVSVSREFKVGSKLKKPSGRIFLTFLKMHFAL
jgi:hypothetical protein